MTSNEKAGAGAATERFQAIAAALNEARDIYRLAGRASP
jgi:hypothetical protein